MKKAKEKFQGRIVDSLPIEARRQFEEKVGDIYFCRWELEIKTDRQSSFFGNVLLELRSLIRVENFHPFDPHFPP